MQSLIYAAKNGQQTGMKTAVYTTENMAGLQIIFEISPL